MAKKKVYVSLILDETGSMEQHRDVTISSFNEYVETLQKDKKTDFYLGLTKFNSSKVEVVCEPKLVGKVEKLTRETYVPNHLTPLYDAIGQTIRKVEKEKKKNVLIVIITDGYENASKEFDRKTIFNMIEEKKKEGWGFVFLGTHMDKWEAESIAIKIGIGANMTARFCSEKANLSNAVYYASNSYASSGNVNMTDYDDDKDYIRDKKKKK